MSNRRIFRPRPLSIVLVLVLSILGLAIATSPVHASIPIYDRSTEKDCTSTPCSASSIVTSASDSIIVTIYCWSSSGSIGSVSDTLNSGFITANSLTLAQTGSTSYTILRGVSAGGSDTVTVNQGTCSSGFSNQFSFTVDIYSFVTGIGATNQNFGSVGSGSGSDTLSMIIQPNSFIYETLANSNGNSACPTLTGSSGQAIRDVTGCATAGGNVIKGTVMDRQYANGGSTASTAAWSAAASSSTFFHLTIELLAAGGSVTSVTACYGACGNPAITLINTNATHTINFNQSFTLFYEFQSGLNGILLNVTVNSAKTYGNNQNLGLGIYTAFCSAGITPFTSSCVGLLQASSQRANPVKGRFALTSPVSVSSGEWIGIAVSGTIAGLDLNATNAGCGMAGDGGICLNPPGMLFTSGTLPASITSSAACTTNASPCNTAGISTTGLWAWITGNVIGGTPIGGVGANCAGLLDCLLPSWVNSLCTNPTPSCTNASGLVWVGILTVFSMFFTFRGAGATMPNVKLPVGEVFMFFALVWIFVLTGVNLLQVWIPLFFFFVISLMYGKHTGRYL